MKRANRDLGRDPDDFDSDPIGESNDFKDAGDGAAAYKILMDVCQADLRCLDAHAHLGNFAFDRMLWLNPSDYQGVRFPIDEVGARTAWEDRREERQP